MSLQLNKSDRKIIKDWINSRFWQLITQYIKDDIEDLTAGIITPINEDMSKPKRNQRDIRIKEMYLKKEFLEIPEYLLNRIGNKTNISVEDDH